MNTEFESLKNTVIGFDTVANTVRIFRTNGLDTEKAVCTDVLVDSAMINRAEFGECLKRALGYYVKNIAALPSSGVVVPDRMISSDYVTIPLMKKNKLLEALKTELKSLYNNIVNLDIITTEVEAGESKLSFFVTMTSMDAINDVNKGLAMVSIPPKITSFSAACSLNTVLYLDSELADKNFLFVDIREKSTIMSFCSESVIRAFEDLPIGHSILRRNKLVPEAALFDHREGFDEVSAAVAKAVASGNEVIQGGNSSFSETVIMDSTLLSDDERETKYFEQLLKTMPKEFRRQLPTTEEDFIFENFHIFEKWITLFLYANSGKNNIPVVDRVIINLPSEYYFINDKLGEQGGTISFRLVNNSGRSKQFTDNFDLFGSLLLKNYNADQVL